MKSAYAYMVHLCCTCLLLICASCFMCSCKKFVEVPPPIDEVGSGKIFTDERTALSAVAGMYSQMMVATLSFINGGFSVFAGLSADEIYNTSTNSTLDPFTNNNLVSTDNSVRSRMWAKGYELIYHANGCIEGLQATAVLNDSVKKQLLGEAKIVRAICHFYLLQLFGDVPLITSTDYRQNAVMPRTFSETVYAQIKSDLEEAIVLLPAAYSVSDRTRPNKWTAMGLLARVYLYNSEWSKAEEYASAVIQSGMYVLSSLTGVFLHTSTETIWQIAPVLSSVNTAEGNAFVPSSATVRPTYAITNGLLAAFENGDQRKVNWTKTNTVGGLPFTYPNKFKVRTNTVKTEYTIALRLAELYLIRAEARVQQNKIAEAKADINIIRSRAGLANTTATDVAEVLAAIDKERRIELFTEWGHRWFDLKRRGLADAVLQPIKSGWQATDVFYPIPFADLQANPNLVQNAGY